MANSKFQKYGIYINSDLTIGLASKNYPKSIYYSPKSMHRIKSCKLQMFPILKDRRSRMRHLNPKDIRLLSASPAYEELSAPFYPSNQKTISFSGAKCARIVFCRCAFIQTQITKREMEQTKLQFQIQINR